MLFPLVFWFSLATLASSAAVAPKKNPKRGLGFAAGDTPGDLVNANQSSSVISWQYNWASLPPAYLTSQISGLQYIPMQWGGGQIEGFAEDVKMQGATTILAFNEPDFINESNMQPTDAAALWMQYLEPLKASGIRLGGPAVTAGSSGRPWLLEFFAACSNCTIDFLPLHWYGSGTEGFYSYLWDVHTQFPKLPLWVTEYAEISPNDTVVADFLNQTINYMDTLDWIERYAWFGYFRPKPDVHYNLLRDDGGLNNLGEIYTGAKTIHTQIVTQTTKQYKTVNGADNPTQGLVTTFPPALNSSPRISGVLGTTGVAVACICATLIACVSGASWTLW